MKQYAPCTDPRCTHEHDQLVYAPRSNAAAETEARMEHLRTQFGVHYRTGLLRELERGRGK